MSALPPRRQPAVALPVRRRRAGGPVRDLSPGRAAGPGGEVRGWKGRGDRLGLRRRVRRRGAAARLLHPRGGRSARPPLRGRGDGAGDLLRFHRTSRTLRWAALPATSGGGPRRRRLRRGGGPLDALATRFRTLVERDGRARERERVGR